MAIYQDSGLPNEIVPITKGGTGSSTQNFVDLTTVQTNIAGNKTFTNNVGIGVVSPVEKLEVNGKIKSTTLQITTPTIANSASPFFYAVLDANGNVLKEPIVSTLSPVLNNTITTPPTTPSVDDAYLVPTGATGVWVGQINKIATWSGASWVFYTPVTNDKTSVLTGTNVGLSYTFDGTNWVVAAVPASNNFALDGNNVTSIKKLGTISNFDLPIITNNIERLRVTTAGNVGIGTTTPTRKLEVTGDGIGFPGDTRYGVSKIWNAAIGDMFGMEQASSTQAGGSPALRIFTGAVGNCYIGFGKYTNATTFSEFARFSPIGNFGIGTTTPTAKLEINNVTAGSGLKFTQLNASSTPVTGTAPLGVDASGNVVVTPGSIFISVDGAVNQSIGSSFTPVLMNNIVSFSGVQASSYNTATGIFMVTTTGTYEITGTLRFQDGQIADTQFGVGVHTSNSDGAWFLWTSINATTSGSNRSTFPYIRVAKFNAGDQLRMISYVDVGSMPIAVAAMQIRFLF